MTLKEINNLTFAAYEAIKTMMLNYDIVPGQRLIFVDLAKKLGVSRTPVNNALSLLAKEGYLDFVPHQGYSVHKLTRQEAEELYELREVLELGTIGKAIRQMTDEHFSRFEKRKIEYEEGISNRVHRQLFVLDAEFHASIIEMLNNAYLAERYRELCRMIFLRFKTEDLKVDRIKEISCEHEAIFEAVRTRDVERAKEIIRLHNLKARESLFAIIFKDTTSIEKIKKNHVGAHLERFQNANL
jgi:DNA-binding GntR family transcriptional regulator